MDNQFKTLLQATKIKEKFLFNLAISLTSDITLISNNERYFTENEFYKLKKERGSCGLSTSSEALLGKVYNMLFNKGDFKSVVRMLYSFRFGTKRKLHSYKNDKDYNWVSKDGNEKCSMGKNDSRAHFRWDFGTRYVLSDAELIKIETFLSLINEKEIGYISRSRNLRIKEVSDLQAFLTETKTSISTIYIGLNAEKTNHVYSLTINNPKFNFVTEFKTGLACSNAVTNECVLESLELSEPADTFEDFANEFDYDSNSISDLQIYKNVVEEWKSVNKLFSEKEIEKLIEILNQ